MSVSMLSAPLTGAYPPSPHPPLPPPQPDVPGSAIDDYFGKSTLLSDANLRDAAAAYCVWSVIFLVAFCILQSRSILYKFRLVGAHCTAEVPCRQATCRPPAMRMDRAQSAHGSTSDCCLACHAWPHAQVSPSVSQKPPLLPEGVNALWAWLWATFAVSDAELLQTAGLDALMMVKMQTLGVQLLLPIALVGGVVLIPINLSGDYVEKSGQGTSASINPTDFMRLTLTNVEAKSPLLWIHFLCVLAFVMYACWLLKVGRGGAWFYGYDGALLFPSRWGEGGIVAMELFSSAAFTYLCLFFFFSGTTTSLSSSGNTTCEEVRLSPMFSWGSLRGIQGILSTPDCLLPLHSDPWPLAAIAF